MELKSNVPTGPIEKRCSQRKFDAAFLRAASGARGGPSGTPSPRTTLQAGA